MGIGDIVIIAIPRESKQKFVGQIMKKGPVTTCMKFDWSLRPFPGYCEYLVLESRSLLPFSEDEIIGIWI